MLSIISRFQTSDVRHMRGDIRHNMKGIGVVALSLLLGLHLIIPESQPGHNSAVAAENKKDVGIEPLSEIIRAGDVVASLDSPGIDASRISAGHMIASALSVSVDDSTYTFGVNLPNTWLTPQTSVITNNGDAAENFIGQISQLTDGTNNWAISLSANGADSIRAQWSTTSDTSSWTDISAYASDFTVATNVAASDSVSFWFRIQTPTSTSSYSEYSSTLTVTAQAY